MTEVYSLYLMEILMQSNGSLPIEVAWRSLISQFPQFLGNYYEFETFLFSQSVLFIVHGNMVYLKSLQTNKDPGYLFQSTCSQLSHILPAQPPVQPIDFDNLTTETEAVKYFQKQLNKRPEKWVQIRSLAGHLSQASSLVRRIVGPQSDFGYFLQRHPYIFEIQGDLVSLRDEMKSNYYAHTLHNSSSLAYKSNRKTRPLSIYLSTSGQMHQDMSGVSDYLNVNKNNEKILQLPIHLTNCQNVQNSRKTCSQTVLITLMDYLAVMWLRQTISNLSVESFNQSASLILLTKELTCAPEIIRNTIGWTTVEISKFLKKFEQIFDLDELNCKARYLRESSLTFVITDSSSTNSSRISMTNKKGIVFCVSRSWGIIDLGEHEHVFFDRSLFKNISDLTNHFVVGEMLFFNAVLAPKESRAKWRATQVWKNSDNLDSQIHEMQSEMALMDISDNSRSSADSDSGVQENNSLHNVVNHRIGSKKKASNSSIYDLQKLLFEVGVKDGTDVTLPFNVVHLHDLTSKCCTDRLILDQLELCSEDVDVECEELEHDEDEEILFRNRITHHNDSDGSNSDLNTMSDILSISAIADTNSFHVSDAQNQKNPQIVGKVSTETQTYFTGDIMAKKVYHEDAD